MSAKEKLTKPLGKAFLKKESGQKQRSKDVFNAKVVKETLHVSAAVFVNLDGEVLLAERPKGKDYQGLWEFPGGKLKQGETPENALVRELNEELGVQVKPENVTPLTFVSCDQSLTDKHLLMYLFKVSKWKGVIQPLEGQKIAWVAANKLNHYITMMPKPDVPVAQYLLKNVSVLK